MAEQPTPDLTMEQIEEMKAVKEITDAIGKPTFIHKSNWRGLYCGIVRKGLVTWDPHPEFGRDFRKVALTEEGERLVAA